MGATSFGYDIARQFGLNIIPCRAALVPLVFNPEDTARWCDLSGLSTEVIAAAEAKRPTRFREKMLITHRGLSGPAILQASSYWQPGPSSSPAPAPRSSPLCLRKGTTRSASALTALRAALPTRAADAGSTHATRRLTNASLTNSSVTCTPGASPPEPKATPRPR
jgi:predicted flavoprotein YhiN